MTAVICVAAGNGQAEVMRRLGAVGIVSGGDTMNPSVEDFMSAIHASQAEHFIILPNNKNVLLAAVQTQKLLGDSVSVLATVNIPQAIAALTAFDPDKPHNVNFSLMEKRISNIKAASITKAVRDSQANGRTVIAGRYIGLIEGQMVADADKLDIALCELVLGMVSPESEVVSLYYGSDVSPSEANHLQALLAQKLGGVQVELYNGGQPHYHFIISVE